MRPSKARWDVERSRFRVVFELKILDKDVKVLFRGRKTLKKDESSEKTTLDPIAP